MAYRIPPTAELAATALAKYETKLAQTSPINDRSFLRVLSAVLAALTTGNYQLAAERATQNLALTATGNDLILIGENFGVVYKRATAAELTAELPATNGTVIDTTIGFIGDANGVRYFPQASATATGGIATLSLIAEETGTVGNLNVSDTLTIERQVAGAETVATITVVATIAADDEEEEDYRNRVLFEIRTVGGGGNAVDYRTWAEQTPGC
jgi:uncharacterized phage protein gp47/JayE